MLLVRCIAISEIWAARRNFSDASLARKCEMDVDSAPPLTPIRVFLPILGELIWVYEA